MWQQVGPQGLISFSTDVLNKRCVYAEYNGSEKGIGKAFVCPGLAVGHIR